MKKIIITMLSMCLLVFLLYGCSTVKKVSTSDDKVSVVSTIFAPYDFVREVAGDKAELTMLLPPASESHSFEPTPQDIIKIQNSDVFIYVGGESDAWVNEVLESMDTSKMKIITLIDCVEVVEEEIVEGMEEEHDHEDISLDEEHEGEEQEGDEHENEEHANEEHEDEEHADVEHEYDEHVWTSPKNAKLIVQKISDVLCEVDEVNKEIYKKNTTEYLGKLDELDQAFQTVVDESVRKTIVFGDRFPFRYFADAYGLSYFAAFPGCSTETEASAATVAFLIDKIKEEQIPVVFHVELSNQKMANTISEATDAKVLLLHACHNVSKAEFESGVTYLDLMYKNVENLKEALK